MAKIRKFSDAINSMVVALHKNSVDRGGFPTVATLMNESWHLQSVMVNSRANPKKTEIKNHAEYKCYISLKRKNMDKIVAIILRLAAG